MRAERSMFIYLMISLEIKNGSIAREAPAFCRLAWPTSRTIEITFHHDVMKWKHFPRYWPFVRGIRRSPVNSPHKGQWRGALMCPLICAWINVWANNRETGDLRRHRAHYDVTVMLDAKARHSIFQVWVVVKNLTTYQASVLPTREDRMTSRGVWKIPALWLRSTCRSANTHVRQCVWKYTIYIVVAYFITGM